ncbi:MAG: helix-turn-helix domain-containing protein [Candidatus Brocadiales bacterium]
MKVTEVKKRLWVMGWSQDSLVKRTGRSKSEVSMVLNGYRRTASVQEAIANAVGVSVEKLFGEWAHPNQKGKAKHQGMDRRRKVRSESSDG